MNVIRGISQQTLQRPSRGRLRSFQICQELKQPGLWSAADPRRTAAPEDNEIPFSGPLQQPPSGGPIPLFIFSCPLSGQASKSLLELHCNCKCLFPDYKCKKTKTCPLWNIWKTQRSTYRKAVPEGNTRNLTSVYFLAAGI